MRVSLKDAVVPFVIAAALCAGGLRNPVWFCAGGLIFWALIAWRRPPILAAWPWLAVAAWSLVSAAASAQPLAALARLAVLLLACGAISWASSWDAADRRRWFWALIGVSFPLAAAALWTGYFRGDAARGHFREQMTGLIPPYYNYTMFVLTAAAAASAAWLLRAKSGAREKWAVIFCVAVALITITLSHSRGAMVGLAAGAATVLFRAGRGSAGFRRVFACALAVGLASGAFLLHSNLTKGRLRGEARPGIWRAAIFMADRAPLFGIGPGNFQIGMRLDPVPVPGAAARYGLSTNYAHGEIFQALGETGWAGALIFLGALLFSLRGLLGPALSAEGEAAAAAAAAMTAQILVDNILQIPALTLLLFTALGMTASAQPKSARGSRWPTWAALLCALFPATAWALAAARADLAKAAFIFPVDSDVLEDLAYTRINSGDYAGSDEYWRRAAELSPYNAVYPWRSAQIAFAMGRFADAEILSRRAILIEPGFLSARLLLAESLARLNKKTEAALELEELDARAAAQLPGPAENGYERTISQLSNADQRESKRLSLNLRER